MEKNDDILSLFIEEAQSGRLSPEQFTRWIGREPRLTAEQANQWRMLLAPASIFELIKKKPATFAAPLLVVFFAATISGFYFGHLASEEMIQNLLDVALKKLANCD